MKHTEESKTKWTPEPWFNAVEKCWTMHGVGAMRDGQPCMILSGNHNFDDACANEQRAWECVNACTGLNPEAVPELVKACEEALVMMRGALAIAPNRDILEAVIVEAADKNHWQRHRGCQCELCAALTTLSTQLAAEVPDGRSRPSAEAGREGA